MTDKLTQLQRHICMSHNKGKDTIPEIIVRKLTHSLGYRYRLHRKDLPGCPDLVFPSHKKVIFVNGCYWHRHSCKKGCSMPETKRLFWQSKFDKTIRRDEQNIKTLKKQGWDVLVIWECQLKDMEKAQNIIVKFLE